MKNSLLLICSLIFSFYATAQDQFDFDYKIESEAFNKERKFYVHVPEHYYDFPTDTFGVVYVLDAQARSFYDNAKGIVDYLVWGYQIMPMIVVGIHSDNRGTEFIPKNRALSTDDPKNSGQAHLLQEHIEKEIFPMINKNFRVNNFKALIGHSRGGAFIASTLFSEKKDLFDAYLAISPGMHYLDGQILNDAETMIKDKAVFNKFYYCTHGTVGDLEKSFKPKVDFIDSLLKAHPNQTLAWKKKEFEGTSHWGVVAPSITYGLLEMNRAYQIDQKLVDLFAENDGKSIAEQIGAYYEKQNQILGQTFPPRAILLRYYGNQQTQYGQFERAIELFDLSLEIDPDNVRTYTSKAWAYQELNDKEAAIKTYKKALEVLEINKKNLKPAQVERWKKNINEDLESM